MWEWRVAVFRVSHSGGVTGFGLDIPKSMFGGVVEVSPIWYPVANWVQQWYKVLIHGLKMKKYKIFTIVWNIEFFLQGSLASCSFHISSKGLVVKAIILNFLTFVYYCIFQAVSICGYVTAQTVYNTSFYISLFLLSFSILYFFFFTSFFAPFPSPVTSLLHPFLVSCGSQKQQGVLTQTLTN
jgi:hypothetical protein